MMAIKLKIYRQKWVCPKGGYVDECRRPENFDRKGVLATKNFRSYSKMADWLDQNLKYKNKVMSAVPVPLKTLGGIRRVVFDGVDTWIERYGHV